MGFRVVCEDYLFSCFPSFQNPLQLVTVSLRFKELSSQAVFLHYLLSVFHGFEFMKMIGLIELNVSCEPASKSFAYKTLCKSSSILSIIIFFLI